MTSALLYVRTEVSWNGDMACCGSRGILAVGSVKFLLEVF